MLGETRADRAERLRAPIQDLVERSSLQQAADAIGGVSIGAIRSLLAGGTPREGTLQAFETWAARARVLPPPEVPPATTAGRPVWLDSNVIGERIRLIRKQRGWSQQQLADYLQMPKSQAEVSRWEQGHTRPGYESLEAIARLAGERIDIFQEGADLGLDFGHVRRIGEWESARDMEDAAQALADVEETTRFLEGVAPAGEEKDFKMDVLELVKRMILKREPRLPDWWYRLQYMVDHEEI